MVQSEEARDGVVPEQVIEARPFGRRGAFARPFRVHDDAAVAVGDEHVEEVRRVAHAGIEKAAQLAVSPQQLPRITLGAAQDGAAALREDLPRHELRLSPRFLHHHAGELGEVHGRGHGHQGQRDQADRDRFLEANTEADFHRP